MALRTGKRGVIRNDGWHLLNVKKSYIDARNLNFPNKNGQTYAESKYEAQQETEFLKHNIILHIIIS